MIGFHEPLSPTHPKLWAIETETMLLVAEHALVDAESAWYSYPCPGTAADYLEALVEVVDLLDFYGHLPRLVVAA